MWVTDKEWRTLDGKLDAILKQLATIAQHQENIMSALDDLATAVAAEDTVIDSAVVLLKGIPALIAAAGTDPAKLAALQADIKAKTTTLANAVAAGTPAAPAP
jgi:hypothetical protein